jgi:hypothetical protein
VRSLPEVVAWRNVLVEVAMAVHEGHIWLRSTRNNSHLLWDHPQMNGLPPQFFLDFLPGYAICQMHKAITNGLYPTLTALLGPVRCA